ncbi:MAG: ABC transporter permease [Bacilli bacterium]|nr:ABC transporter permease [Bacilli bacterium]
MKLTEHEIYLNKIKKEKKLITFFQILIIISFLLIWELLSDFHLINSFLSSSPKEVIKTIISLIQDKTLFKHISITLYETLISFIITSTFGFLIATTMWFFKKLSKIIDPYLTILNALPKVALGPLIIIWIGASTNSIICMALLISLFITIINIYNGFTSVNKNYITLLKSLNASKKDIFIKVIIPSNKKNLISCTKINISMTLIGIIMGELLVSKEGLGYLIMYGSQVFNINLVITSVFILGVIAFLMYELITKIESKITR